MCKPIIVATLILSPWISACAGSSAGTSHATRLTFAESAFDEPRVLVATSMPPQFDVMLTRDMPTPGWRLEVDSLDVDDAAGRIVAKVTEIAPQGVTAQVITPTECRLPLGRLKQGRYVLELWLRRGTSIPYKPVQAFVVVAR